MRNEEWAGQSWNPFISQSICCRLQRKWSSPGLPNTETAFCCPTEKSEDYFTALPKSEVCMMSKVHLEWPGVWHKASWMILKLCARRSVPKQNSVSYSSNWDYFDGQIIPRRTLGRSLFGTSHIHAKNHSDYLIPQLKVCQCPRTVMAHCHLYSCNCNTQIT